MLLLLRHPERVVALLRLQLQQAKRAVALRQIVLVAVVVLQPHVPVPAVLLRQVVTMSLSVLLRQEAVQPQEPRLRVFAEVAPEEHQ